MTLSTTNHSLRHLTVAITAGVLALGLSGAASAHGADSDHRGGGYRSERAAAEVHHHYYNESRRTHRNKHHHKHYRKHRGHRRGHHSPKEVHIHNYYEAPVEVVQVYEPPRRVMHHSFPQDAYGYERSRGSAQLNAGSLMGAAIGGLIGSQIGGGKGKLAATAAGSVGGFLLGDHATQGYR